MNQKDFAKGFILRWEDGNSTDPKKTHSMNPADSGNYQSGVYKQGPIIGSNHGVTAPALAQYLGKKTTDITYDVMHKLSLDTAADIALKNYYVGPGLDKLDWNRVTASVFDFGWGAGPVTAKKMLQGLIGATPDGIIGPGTVKAYKSWLLKTGEIEGAHEWARKRLDYYEALIKRRPKDAIYRNGWRNRTQYFLPNGEEQWWEKFDDA